MFWCAGMFASGSTWAYNIMRGIAGDLWPGRQVRGRFVNTLADMQGLEDASAVHVVKSHDLSPEVAAAMLPLADKIVVTIRDPRDAVTSLMLYQHYPFAMAIKTVADSARYVGGLVDDQRALLLRYEDGFTDDITTLDRIAELFGGTLSPGVRDALFVQSRRGAIEAAISGLGALPQAVRDPRSGDIFDPETQWHKHHAGRSGEVGRWRRALAPAQVSAIEQEMAEWMARFGYERAPPQVVMGYSLRVGSVSFKS